MFPEDVLGKTVLHRPTGTVGVAESVHYHSEFRFTSAATTTCPVLKLANGHSFVATNPSAFQVLSDQEARYHQGVCEVVANMTRELALFAKSSGMEMTTFQRLTASALVGQVRALETGFQARQDAVDGQAAPDDAGRPLGGEEA